MRISLFKKFYYRIKRGCKSTSHPLPSTPCGIMYINKLHILYGFLNETYNPISKVYYLFMNWLLSEPIRYRNFTTAVLTDNHVRLDSIIWEFYNQVMQKNKSIADSNSFLDFVDLGDPIDLW